MSLTINTNLSSLLVQSSLTKSTNGLNQAIERMTTGFKINGAKDNAAGYSIANSMGVKLSSYDVAMDNVMLGTTLIDTATSNLSLITEHLQRIRDLSEQAANGTYGEDSLNAIQSEIDARTAEINRIIANTEYNGIKLFEGEETSGGTDGSTANVDESKRVVNQTTFQSGETYYLTTSDDLVKLQDMVNSGVDTTAVTFELACDINMSGVEFRGIGDDSIGVFFAGTFNGNNHVISNLKIETTVGYVGLFGQTQGATIDSARLRDCEIEGGYNVGGLVGYAGTNTKITNSSVTGNINATGAIVGGLVGKATSSTITNSYSMGSVVVQQRDADFADDGLTILASYASGYAVMTAGGVGGLIGSAVSNSTVTSCYSTSNVEGKANTGGLVGSIDSSSIQSSYSSGNVNGGTMVGGLAGLINQSSIIEDSYAKGNVSGNDSVGGLVGYVNSSAISGSYSIGQVVGKSLVGGFAGSINSSTITDSYYDKQNFDQRINLRINSAGDDVDFAVGVTTAELKALIENGTLPEYDYEKIFGGGSGTGVGVNNSGREFILQVGIDSDENSKLTFDTALGFQLNIDVTSQTGALATITVIDSILETVNNKQTELGSVQNRLDSVLESLSINIENLTSSQSTIKDADIAEESSAYIKYQILQQASATLLATANQSPSIALQLL